MSHIASRSGALRLISQLRNAALIASLTSRETWARLSLFGIVALFGAVCAIGCQSGEIDENTNVALQELTPTCKTLQRGGLGTVADTYLDAAHPSTNFGAA